VLTVLYALSNDLIKAVACTIISHFKDGFINSAISAAVLIACVGIIINVWLKTLIILISANSDPKETTVIIGNYKDKEEPKESKESDPKDSKEKKQKKRRQRSAHSE
jgi:hypothetical protein